MSNPKFPSNCPMHNEKPDGTTKNDNKSSCPITHSGDALSPENQIPTNLGHLPAPGQQIPLPTHRLTSSIPKAYSAEYWEYPSPQQFYNALVRKGWETPEDSVETMVDIHNFLNEAAWNEILKWESTKKCKCGDPKLLRFRGRPHELSPKARMLQWAGKIFSFMGTPPPFDRHDWTIDRCGKEVRYVIDYYSGPDEGDTPIFYLDVRPALDSIENNKEKQKLNNLRKTFQPLNKLRKRELRKFIQNTNTYQYNNNSSVNNKSASISTSPSHFTQPITYYGKSIKSRIPTTDLASLKKELQSINSSSLIKRRNFGTLFNEVEGDREEIELSMKEIREGFSKRDESIMDMEPRRSINLKPLKSGSSGSNTSRVSSSHTQRSNSPSMHKSMMVKEKLSKKKKSNNKQKNNDSDTDDLYIPPGHHRKEITKSGSLHKKKKIKKEFSDDDSDSSDFGKNHIKNSRQSTPVRTTNSGSVTKNKNTIGTFKTRKRSTSETIVTPIDETPVVKTKDQIPIKTFYEYVDPYVRELKQEDLDFLLGKHYDWTIDRCGKEVRYVIDYYSGPDEGDTPIFYLDVRPALDSIENNKEKQKLNNLRKTFQPLNKLRKRELRKFIQNTNTYQYNNNSSVNNKSASISTSPSHFTQPITYYGKSIKSRIPTTDLASLKKELQSINSSSLIKRRNFGTLFNEVEGDREEIELSMKEIREGFSKRDESIMDMEPRRSINLKPLKSGSSGSNTSRVSSSHTQRSNSPSMHKSMMVKEKLSKKKKSNNKQKNNDSDTDDLYIPPGHHRKEITKSGSLHKKKKIKKEFSDDDSDSSDFGKNHIKNSRQSTPVRTTNSGSVTKNKNTIGTFKTRKRSTSETIVTPIDETPVVKTKDQIPIKTFYEYVDPYVRELKQEDLDFLSSKCDEFIGPISQRLVMSLIDYGDNFNQQEGRHYLQTNGQNDFDTQDCNVNDRVLRELKALGLVDDDDVSAQWNGREDDEDDEIGRELRELQAKLHELERKNAYRKAVLRGRVKDLMGYQQYLHFETEVNNEIEETYLARFPDKQRGIKRGRNGARKTIPGDDEVRKQIERRNELSKLIA
ncbi:3893_t:CDS:10 [Entrophospora sp. SA101]|nr:3893_t:CDS:10 [Entrophospora sp. SA101]